MTTLPSRQTYDAEARLQAVCTICKTNSYPPFPLALPLRNALKGEENWISSAWKSAAKRFAAILIRLLYVSTYQSFGINAIAS
jgi:hypothetical protein